MKDEKLQCDISREAAKRPALSSGEINKYKFFTRKEILSFNRNQMMDQATFTYSPLGKTLEKQPEALEKHGEKQIGA